MSKHTMKKFNPAPRNSRGYGLMEALIVAVCIAVGIAAIYTFYQKVYATQEAHEESQNVAELTNRIMKAYGPMANFTGLSTSSVINEGVVPSSIGVSGGGISFLLSGATLLLHLKTLMGLRAQVLVSLTVMYLKTSVPSLWLRSINFSVTVPSRLQH